MRATLLVYNVSAERIGRLRYICMRMGVKVQAVPPEEWNQPLAAVLGLMEKTDAEPCAEGAFADEMLVMHGFSGTMVNGLLAGIRQAKMKPFALKAIVTPTNVQWSSVMLHEQLNEEHRAVMAGQKSVHAEG